MKKILCLIDTLGMGGGAERQMAGLAGLLHQKGYNVTLATYHMHESDDFIEKRYGVRSVLIKTKPSILSKLLMVRNYIKDNCFDVVIVYKDGASMMASMIKTFGGNFRLIVSERNTTQTLNRRERIKFILYRRADVIVPNSNSQGDYIRKNFPHLSNKIKVITNFTDTNYFNPGNKFEEPKENQLKILVTARIVEQKNVLGFMRAIKKLKEKELSFRIDWYGSKGAGPQEYEDEVIKEYEELGLSDIFTFHHATPNILRAYQACDAFCLPSIYEGYPNVVCEAMSCEKPILCSDVCDNSTIVEDGVNGYLFNPFDEDDIAEKIEKLYNLPEEERLRMGKKSREIAEVKFSEEGFVNKYIDLIEY